MNLVGAFVLGVVLVFAAETRGSRHLRLLVGTGFCGALTTSARSSSPSTNCWPITTRARRRPISSRLRSQRCWSQGWASPSLAAWWRGGNAPRDARRRPWRRCSLPRRWRRAAAYEFQFPAGTLAVNLSGSLLLGALVGLSAHHGLPESTATVLGAGLAGGYTTLSTWAWESIALAERGARGAAAINVVGSLGARHGRRRRRVRARPARAVRRAS